MLLSVGKASHFLEKSPEIIGLGIRNTIKGAEKQPNGTRAANDPGNMRQPSVHNLGYCLNNACRHEADVPHSSAGSVINLIACFPNWNSEPTQHSADSAAAASDAEA
jgi:hypothetical protein